CQEGRSLTGLRLAELTCEHGGSSRGGKSSGSGPRNWPSSNACNRGHRVGDGPPGGGRGPRPAPGGADAHVHACTKWRLCTDVTVRGQMCAVRTVSFRRVEWDERPHAFGRAQNAMKRERERPQER